MSNFLDEILCEEATLVGPKLVAITGYAGHGKDSIGSVLTSHFGYGRCAFADPILGMIQNLLTTMGVDLAYTTERSKKEVPIPGLGVSYRRLARTLGTEWGRNLISKRIWLAALEGQLRQTRAKGHTQVCITDLRFENEELWCKEVGATIVKVFKPGAPIDKTHPSETHIENIKEDILIHNDGSLSDLSAKVDELFYQGLL